MLIKKNTRLSLHQSKKTLYFGITINNIIFKKWKH
jgi:hypothetical protein